MTCNHHWHCHPTDREVITTGIGKGKAMCCHCGSTAHVSLGKHTCGRYEDYMPATQEQDACCIREKK